MTDYNLDGNIVTLENITEGNIFVVHCSGNLQTRIKLHVRNDAYHEVDERTATVSGQYGDYTVQLPIDATLKILNPINSFISFDRPFTKERTVIEVEGAEGCTFRCPEKYSRVIQGVDLEKNTYLEP